MKVLKGGLIENELLRRVKSDRLLARTTHGFRSVAGKARAAFCVGAH